MAQVRDKWLCLEMMPDGVLEFWSIGVLESIKPVSKNNSSMVVLC
jgi:hypothetical protein